MVDHVVVVEVKCTDRNTALYRRQLLTYLRLMRLQVGLVLNIGLETMKEEIDRVVNDRVVPWCPVPPSSVGSDGLCTAPTTPLP